MVLQSSSWFMSARAEHRERAPTTRVRTWLSSSYPVSDIDDEIDAWWAAVVGSLDSRGHEAIVFSLMCVILRGVTWYYYCLSFNPTMSDAKSRNIRIRSHHQL